MNTISIIIPTYNSHGKVISVIDQLKKINFRGVRKEIIVVDDASPDSTFKELRKIKGITIFHHKKNIGKGGAVKTGLSHAKGNILFIQDDDLEYSPADIPQIIEPILQNKAKVVFGSRRLNKKNLYSSPFFYYGGVLIDHIISFILHSNTTDAITGSKAFTKEVYQSLLPIESYGFEIEAEITAKVIKNGFGLIEVPISYNPRSIEEGKNIRWHHAYPIIKTLIKYAWFS